MTINVGTNTTTELKASSSTPTVGEAVTYTATVTPVPTSGTIAFEDEGKAISGCGTQTVNTTTGKATCEQTYGTPGVHPITAAYSGSTDTLYTPSSTSGATTITVRTATTTGLKASNSTPKVGEAVTYTATVAPVPTSGTVAFEDEGTPIGGCETQTVNTSTGKATCEQTYASRRQPLHHGRLLRLNRHPLQTLHHQRRHDDHRAGAPESAEPGNAERPVVDAAFPDAPRSDGRAAGRLGQAGRRA